MFLEREGSQSKRHLEGLEQGSANSGLLSGAGP